jgi:hypothetical protein
MHQRPIWTMGSSRKMATRKLKTWRFRNETLSNIVLHWKAIDKRQGKEINSFSHIPSSEPCRVERLGMSENMVPRSMCEERKGREEWDAGENCLMRNCAVCMSRRISLRRSLQGRWYGRIDGRIEVTERRARSRKQLLDNLKERRGFWKLKGEAPDRPLWRTHCGRGYGPVVKQDFGKNEWGGWEVLDLRTKKRNTYRVLVGKPEGLRAPEMSRHNQEDNIRMDLKSHERNVGDWTMWLRIRFIGCPLWIRASYLAEKLVASYEDCSLE